MRKIKHSSNPFSASVNPTVYKSGLMLGEGVVQKHCNINILIIDDEPFHLRLFSRQLAALGFEYIETHQSSVSALQQLQREEVLIDLIFLDLNMPELDGVEFLRRLAETGYAGRVILVSGEDRRVLETATRLARGFQLNILGHLGKPSQPHALVSLLENWLPMAPKALAQSRQPYAPDEIRRGIHAGELVNYYQPQVSLADGSLVGVETLVRWRHPVDGLVFPDQFIGIAEEHGFIGDLTRMVLSDAIAQAKRWRDSGFDLRVAVNVSMDDLTRLDFPEFVMARLAHYAVPAGNLIIEVTESRLLKNTQAPLEILARLRLKHVGLSIDDFGTGHSSLAQLRDMPFNELKIDRSFVHGAHETRTLDAIFSATLSMAKSLDMSTVAEGVEDQADWDYMRQCGCDVAQGYFIAKPMPFEQLMDWLSEWGTHRH